MKKTQTKKSHATVPLKGLSDQLFSIGADSSPATSLSLSMYNLLLYGCYSPYLLDSNSAQVSTSPFVPILAKLFRSKVDSLVWQAPGSRESRKNGAFDTGE